MLQLTQFTVGLTTLILVFKVWSDSNTNEVSVTHVMHSTIFDVRRFPNGTQLLFINRSVHFRLLFCHQKIIVSWFCVAILSYSLPPINALSANTSRPACGCRQLDPLETTCLADAWREPNLWVHGMLKPWKYTWSLRRMPNIGWRIVLWRNIRWDKIN